MAQGKSGYVVWAAAMAVVLAGQTACDHSYVGTAGRHLDKVERGLDEYGTATVSSPLLAPSVAGKSPFAFELDKKPVDFFNDAQSKIEGGSAQSDQRIAVLKFGAKVGFDPGAMAQYQDALKQYQAGQGRTQAFQQVSDAAAMRQYQDQLSLYNNSQSLQRAAIEQQYAADVRMAADAKEPDRSQKMAAAEKTKADAVAALAKNTPPQPPATPAAPAYPTEGAAPTPDANLLPTPDTGAFSGSTFTAPGGLLGNSSPTVSDRSAIISAAGDTATSGIFRLLGDPAAQISFKDKKILFGASMVSVNPGWRTKKGFAADVSVRVSYDYVPARWELIQAVRAQARKDKEKGSGAAAVELALLDEADLDQKANARRRTGTTQPAHSVGDLRRELGLLGEESPQFMQNDSLGGGGRPQVFLSDGDIPAQFRADGTNTSPLVAAVSPMTDVQTLDLSNSGRSQSEIAADIAAALQYAGLKAQAESFASYAKRHERDVKTRNASAAVNTYSNSGGLFGFQVGPRLKALENPAADETKTADVLERQSFPVLVLIGMDDTDLGLRFRYERGRLVVLEPALRFEQSVRWLPLRGDRSANRLTEGDRFEWAGDLATIENGRTVSESEWRELAFRVAAAKEAVQQLRQATANHNAGDLRDWGSVRRLVMDEALFPKDSAEREAAIVTILNATAQPANPLASTAKVDVVSNVVEAAAQSVAQLKPHPDSTVAMVRNRASVLSYAATGSFNVQGIPLDFLKPINAAPALTAVFPPVVTYDPGKLGDASHQALLPMLATGQNLKPLVEASKNGNLSVEAVDGLAPAAPPAAKAQIAGVSENGLLISYIPAKDTNGKAIMPKFIAFKVSATGPEKAVVFTPPVQLSPVVGTRSPNEWVTVRHVTKTTVTVKPDKAAQDKAAADAKAAEAKAAEAKAAQDKAAQDKAAADAKAADAKAAQDKAAADAKAAQDKAAHDKAAADAKAADAKAADAKAAQDKAAADAKVADAKATEAKAAQDKAAAGDRANGPSDTTIDESFTGKLGDIDLLKATIDKAGPGSGGQTKTTTPGTAQQAPTPASTPATPVAAAATTTTIKTSGQTETTTTTPPAGTQK